jgi:hypothetical protein
MADAGIAATCFTCGIGFTYNPEKLNTFIPRYQIIVCPSCWRRNEDGWRYDHTLKIKGHLKAYNIPLPKENTQGLYPRS